MNPKPEKPQDLNMQQAMRMAASPAGQQLLAALQRQGGTDFQKAKDSVAAGNYDQAKQALSALMGSPEIQDLLRQLEKQS